MHCLVGGLYLGGLTFVLATTILPKLVEMLDAPIWIKSLAPTLLIIGFSIPGPFTAHFIERLVRVKPLLLLTGIFQRLPYLVAGIMLLCSAGRGMLALYAVILAQLISGLIGGSTLTGWQELIVKTVPAERRASMFAIRNIISGVIGILAGWFIAFLLGAFPGVYGFGILHLVCFGLLVLSYIFFAMIRETHQPARDTAQHTSLSGNLRGIPGIIMANKQIRNYIAAVFTACGFYMIVPFLSPHALAVTGRENSYLGVLVLSQMIGAILGNIVSGLAGDKVGAKPALIGSRILMAAMCIWVVFARDTWEFTAIFFLLGASTYGLRVAHMAFSTEIVPFQKRSTCLAIIMFTSAPGLIAAGTISATLLKYWDSFAATVIGADFSKQVNSFTAMALASCASILLSAVIVSRVKDPRGRKAVDCRS